MDALNMYFIEWIIIVVLVILSGLFSGLNLGLMGLDPIGLQIVTASDKAKHREAARKIAPLRKHGNWLLCTLLIGNVAVNSALSILLAHKTNATIGFIIATATITLFGEIIPQAICSRYALEIGAKAVWIVWPLMFIMGIIAYPIAFLLDKILGGELGTAHIYSNKELQKLVDIHAGIEGTGVSGDTAGMLKGALGLREELVLNCMTSMKDVFWLTDSSKLSFDVLTEIFKSGHSRIPIFATSDRFGRIACVGLLYVKDLILLDPDDEMPVTQIMNAFKHKTPPTVWKDDTLQHLLEIFVSESQHLAFVQDVVTNKNGGYEMDNVYEYVGIITLEDVIEHVLQTQLIDEHDNFVDNKHMMKTNRLNRIDWSMLHIFDHRQRVSTTLPPQELQAVYHFLSQTIKVFTPQNRICSEASVKNMLSTSSVIRVVVSQRDHDNGNTVMTQLDPYKDIEDNGLLLYLRDKKTKYFSLLLDGKCEVYAGRQGFRCELSRWSYLCPAALDQCVECYRYNKPLLDYVPDFTAKIIENSRILRIKLDDFVQCLKGKFDINDDDHPMIHRTKSPNIFLCPHPQITNESTDKPHIITQLPTPHNISDNSRKISGKDIEHNLPILIPKCPKNINPNYRLMERNNLSNTNTPHFDANDEELMDNTLLGHERRHRIIQINDDDERSPKRIKKHSFLYQPLKTLDDDDDNKYNENNNKFKKIENEHIYKYKTPTNINTNDNTSEGDGTNNTT